MSIPEFVFQSIFDYLEETDIVKIGLSSSFFYEQMKTYFKLLEMRFHSSSLAPFIVGVSNLKDIKARVHKIIKCRKFTTSTFFEIDRMTMEVSCFVALKNLFLMVIVARMCDEISLRYPKSVSEAKELLRGNFFFIEKIDLRGLSLLYIPEELQNLDLSNLKTLLLEGNSFLSEKIVFGRKKFECVRGDFNILNLSYFLQERADVNNLEFWKEVFLLIMKLAPESLAHLDDHFFSPELFCESVKQEKLIPALSNFVYEKIERVDPKELLSLKDRVTKVWFLASLYYMTTYEREDILRFIPQELRDITLCKISVEKRGKAIRFVPKKLFSKSLFIKAIQRGCSIREIPKGWMDEELVIFALKECGADLENVPEDFINFKICYLAVQQGCSLKKIPRTFINYEMAFCAVDLNGCEIENVPPPLLNRKICERAVRRGCSIELIPKIFRDRDLCNLTHLYHRHLRKVHF